MIQPTLQEKNLFKSKTFWGAIGTYGSAMYPLLETGFTSGFTQAIVFNIFIATSTFITAVYGRYKATHGIYTNPGLPGKNKTLRV